MPPTAVVGPLVVSETQPVLLPSTSHTHTHTHTHTLTHNAVVSTMHGTAAAVSMYTVTGVIMTVSSAQTQAKLHLCTSWSQRHQRAERERLGEGEGGCCTS